MQSHIQDVKLKNKMISKKSLETLYKITVSCPKITTILNELPKQNYSLFKLLYNTLYNNGSNFYTYIYLLHRQQLKLKIYTEMQLTLYSIIGFI